MKNSRKNTDKKQEAKLNMVNKMDLPKDLLLGAVNVKITGKWEMYVENYKSIIEYTDTVIKLQGKDTRIKIIGKKLKISCYTKEDMEIKGIINEVIYY